MLCRSRGLSARTTSPRRSSASALSGSANRGVSFARYSALTSSLALKAHCAFNFEQAQRIEVHSRATLFLTAISSRSADLAHKVHWTLCIKPNHALKELEMRYAISSSVKALMQVDPQSSDGDSSNEEEKSRISGD